MGFNPVTYGASSGYTNQVALGLSNVSIDNTTGTVTISLTDGTSASWTFPKPANGKDGKDGADGVGVKEVNIETNDKGEYHLIVTYTDDTTYDAGEVPKQIVAISKEAGNALTSKADGLYVAGGNVEISKKEGNIIKSESDGLYAEADTIEISKVEKNTLEQKDDGLYVPETDLSLYAKSEDVVAKNQTEANKGKILIVGNDGNVTTGDAPSGVEVVEITKAEYDKLTSDERKGKFFNTTDEEDLDLSVYAKKTEVPKIDDTLTTNKNIWSAHKTNQEIEKKANVITILGTTPASGEIRGLTAEELFNNDVTSGTYLVECHEQTSMSQDFFIGYLDIYDAGGGRVEINDATFNRVGGGTGNYLGTVNSGGQDFLTYTGNHDYQDSHPVSMTFVKLNSYTDN